MKIAFFELREWEVEPISKAFAKHDLKLYKEKLQEKIEEVRDFDCISVKIYSAVSKELIEKMPNLKLITTRSTGFDHVDLSAAKKRKITVCNVPHYSEEAVAEHTFALIFALAKNIVQAAERTRKGNFNLKNLMGFELQGKTLGIVGCGNIGKRVAQIAHCLGMNILVYDPKEDKKLAKKLNLKYLDYEQVLGQSDIITFHVPLLPQTRHLLNKNNIDKVKKGAVLINTSRGEVIETEAIYIALEKGILRAAGLDVLEEECALKEESQLLSEEFAKTCNLTTLLHDHLLLKKDNVIISPHSAFYSKEAINRILEVSIENILKFIAKNPINVVKT